jgi:hypothetical protein
MNNMTCREFDEVVHEIVRMELLDVALSEAARDHAVRCGNCADRMAEAAALAEASEAAGRSLQGQQAPPSVEAALLAGFRNHHRRAARRRTFEWAAVGAVAAVMLIFAWTVAGPSRGPSSPAPRKDVSSHSNGPLDARGPSSQSAEKVSVTEAEEVNAATGETLAAENFVRLPYADEIGPEDLGMVVRVQLTRASLTELGYPAIGNLNPDDNLVSADVLVGEDGWPRAVRLVQ